METVTLTDTGCYLDNHRGHYIARDVIDMATGWGFIIAPADEFVVRMYDNSFSLPLDIEYPHESITELCDAAIEWLNSGQDVCQTCMGSDNLTGESVNTWRDNTGKWRCKICTGTGRGPRIAGQNFPPIVPEDHYWSFNEGDFGLYNEEHEELMQ